MRSVWRRISLIGSLVLLVVLSGFCYAQATFGTIFGTVTDSSGATVAQATVTIKSMERGTVRTVKTSDSGEYTVPDLDLGSYTVSVQAAGFKTSTSPPIAMAVKARIRLDEQLQVGEISQTVSVQEASPLVRTGSAEVSNVITGQELHNLPVLSRNILTLASLTAGTNGGNASGRQAGISGAELVVNGAFAESNNFIIDGVSDNMEFSGTIAILPPIDAIQEFAIQTSQYSAEFGHSAGAVVNMALKSGTNQFHGFAYDYLQNDVLNAQPYDFTGTHPAKPPLRRNQFGFGAGGPLKRNKIFWFGDYEGLRRPSSAINQYIIPTLAQRSGNFSQSGYTIYDPATAHFDPAIGQIVRNAFPNNIIPSTRISAAGAGLLGYFPAPNIPNVAPGGYNFVTSQRTNEILNNFNAKGDINFSASSTLSMHVSQQRRALSNTGEFTDGRLGVTDHVNGDNAGISYTHIFSPRVLNEARVAYNRLDFPVNLANTQNVIDQYNIPGWHTLAFGYGYPTVNITNLSSAAPVRPIQVFPPPFALVENTYQYLDSLSWQVGSHAIKIGGEVDHIREDRFQDRSGGGILNFSGSYTTQLIGQAVSSPRSGVADMVLGLASSLTTQYAFDAVRIRSYTASGFVQDDWRVTPQLTVNLGLRYDFYQPYHENQDRFANFNLNTGIRLVPESARSVVQSTLGLSNGNLPAGWAYVPLDQVMRHPNYKDFSPRIGLAYAVGRKVSIRAGFGIFFTSTSNNSFNNQGTDGNPFFFDFTLSGDTQNPVLLTSGFPSSGINSVLGSTSFGAYYGPLNRADPYAEKYSFNVEWAPQSSLLFDLGYVGQRSMHFPTLELGNQPMPGPTPLVQRVPYPNVGTFYFYVPIAISQYNGMTFSVTANNWHNAVFKSAFTYSKALGYNTGTDGSITNRYNLHYDYGPIDYDTKYRWVTSAVYRIPTGHSLPKAANAVLGNWDISGVLTVQSGFPFTVNYPGGVLNIGSTLGTGDRPNVVTDPNYSGGGTIRNWFNTAAFQAAPSYVWGNEGKNMLRGPSFTNLDLALQKRVVLPWESHSFTLRMEGNNLFNHVELGLPNLSFGTATFGQITTLASNPRTLQVALRYEF